MNQRNFQLDYSFGGLFVPAPDDLVERVNSLPHYVACLERGSMIDAFYKGDRVTLRYELLRPATE